MKKQFLIQVFILFFISASAQNFDWAIGIGSVYADEGNSITTDPLGNVYTIGGFLETVDFDPGPGTTYLTATQGSGNIFISKMDAYGNLIWAKGLLGSGVNISGNSIAVDGSGNVYTTGYFSGTVDFDPGTEIFNLSASSTSTCDIFISKLDSSGNFRWAKSLGGNSSDAGNAIALDRSGNVYVTGYYFGTVDFDPDGGFFNLTSVGITQNIFVLKLDHCGDFIWAKSMGGGEDPAWGNSIAVDTSANVYTTGYFGGTADFDPGTETYYLTSSANAIKEIFISKLDASGNFKWARRAGGNGDDVGNSIVLDALGNVYVAGCIQDDADFGPFNLFTDGCDVFNVKLDSLGNYKWAKSMGNTVSTCVYGTSLAVDISGNVYTTGHYYGGAVDFDPGNGTYYLPAHGDLDIFISELDAAGNFVFAKSLGGAGDDRGHSISLDAAGNLYTTGLFSDSVDLNGSEGTANLISVGYVDVFILKLKNFGSGISENSQSNLYAVFPNPTSSQINVRTDATLVGSNYSISNLLGKTVLKGKLDSENTVLELVGLTTGMYLLTLGDNSRQTFKVVKQ